MVTAEEALREKAIRELERRHEDKRQSLHEFMKFYWLKEKREELIDNRHIRMICEKLEKVYMGEIKRLIINIPPRSLKTELVSKAFPVRCLGHEPNLKFMEISYSATLAEKNSGGARDMYNSQTYRMVFPRRSKLKEDQNTKQHWEKEDGGQYYASGSDGTITGIGCDIMIIDDPLRPDDANSDVMRMKINNNYHDTLYSRLNDKREGAIVIIMQRLHDDDLTGHLLEGMRKGTGDEWDTLIVPAIGEEDDGFRKKGESFFEARFPIKLLEKMRDDPETKISFSTQYQQNPVNKESQEFHEERIRYYGEGTGNELPAKGRIFTACDPAFSKNKDSDFTAIITAKFDGLNMYVLEYSHGKYDPNELIEKLIYHKQKRNPEAIGIEAFQAQQMIGFNLKIEMEKRGLYSNITEIRQTGDKETKIRKLIPLYRNGHIWHRHGMSDLESEMIRFPRAKHDDLIDAMQMLYSMYEITPNTGYVKNSIKIEYDQFGRPIMVGQDDRDWLLDT